MTTFIVDPSHHLEAAPRAVRHLRSAETCARGSLGAALNLDDHQARRWIDATRGRVTAATVADAADLLGNRSSPCPTVERALTLSAELAGSIPPTSPSPPSTAAIDTPVFEHERHGPTR